MAKPYELDCPVARSLEVIGERWTLLIIRELLMGRARYGEIVSALPGIPPNLLSDRLRFLESEGILARLDPKGYTLTEKGRSLAPALGALAVWGMRYYEEPPSAVARHAGCGGRVHGHWTCDVCGEEVSSDHLELLAPSPPTVPG